MGGTERGDPGEADDAEELSTVGLLVLALLVGVLEQVGRLLPAQWPRRDLDVSWMMGLELARQDGLQHGSDIIFSYGPWGFLSAPTPLDVSDLVVTGCFRVLAVGLLFLALTSTLRGVRHAVLIAAVLALLMGNASQSGWLLLLALTVWALSSLARRDTPPVHALAVAAAVAALLFQMKLTEGVLALLVLGLLTVGRRRWAAGLATLAAFVVAFALWWLAAGQSLPDIPRWLRLGWQIVAGYGEAMSYVRPSALMIAMVVGVVVAAALTMTVRGLDPVARVALLGALLFFTKVALSLPDTAHLEPGYAAVVAVLAVILGVAAKGAVRTTTVAAMCCLCLLLTAGSPIVGRRTFSLDDRSLAVFDSRHEENLAGLRGALIADLDVSREVLAALRGHPVSIDPWEISTVWAYDLDWRPLPIFQQYQPYTPALDEANARALMSDSDLRVLREPAREHPRHPLWDTPAYTLALLCNFERVASDAVWTALARGESRCGAEQPLSSQRVEAGQVIELPTPVDSVVAIRFAPDARRLADRLLGLVGVERHLLRATVDGKRYRVPEALADGPLIVGSSEQEPVLFDSSPSQSISFDRAGRLEIVEIPLVGSRG